MLSEKIGHELPSLGVMNHFYGLLVGLRSSLDEQQQLESLRKTQQLLVETSSDEVP